MRGRPHGTFHKRETPNMFRDGRLATVPEKKLNRSKLTNDKGYAAKCQKQGIFLRVTISIKEFRQKYPNSTYIDTWKMLHEEYPFVFDTPPDKVYPGNVSKIINSNPEWQEAYFCGKEDLIKMAEYKLSKLLESDKTSSSDIIKIYDTLKKYEEYKEDEDDDSNEITFSIGFKGTNDDIEDKK